MSGEQEMYDIFFSYARTDNQTGNIDRLVETIQSEYERFFPDKKLRCFFDTRSIENGEDWRNRLYTGLKHSRMMISMLSESYLASPWCRREWQAWCDIERSRGWLTYMLCPVYYVEVPGSNRRIENFVKQRDDFARQLQAFSLGRSAEELERFEEDECLAELVSRQTVDLQSWYHEGEQALQHDEIRRRIEGLARSIDAKVTLSKNAELTEGDFIRANRHFTGRIHELKLLRQCFSERESGVLPVLHGLGGEGKTALALAYAHAFAYDYPGGRFRVACEGAQTLKQCFARLGEEQGLDFSGCAEPGARYEKTWNWLAGRPNGRTLVVLDNIDSSDLLTQASIQGAIKPTDRVHVLATSRCSGKSVGKAGLPVPVTGLSAGDSLRLLDSYRIITEEDRPHALELAGMLGGHALSLELAGAFLRENVEAEYALFAAALRESGTLEVLEQARDSVSHHIGHEEAGKARIELLLEPSLQALNEEETLALILTGHMSPDALSGPWLREGLSRLLPETMGKKGLVSPWHALLRKLMGLCLWQEENTPETFRMHRLVREVVQARFNGAWGDLPGEALAAQLRDIALEAVERHGEGRASWHHHHFFAVARTLELWLERPEQAAFALELVPQLVENVLRGTGRYEECGLIIAGAERAVGTMPPGREKDSARAICSRCMGLVLLERGLPDEAIVRFVEALQSHENRDDADSAEGRFRRARCLDFLGAAHLALGDAPNAVLRHRTAVALLDVPVWNGASEAMLQELSYSLNHLAGALGMLPDEKGREESLALKRRSLDIRKGLLADKRDNTRLLRDVGISLDLLGNGLLKDGRAEEAGALYEEALENARLLHEKDPQNVIFRRDLSVSLNKTGDALLARHDFSSALERYEKALALRETLLGEEPDNELFRYDVSLSQIKCGDALLRLGRLPEALGRNAAALAERRKLVRHAPANRRYRFGTALALEKMAVVRKERGETEKAAADYASAMALLCELRDENEPGSPGWLSLDADFRQLEMDAAKVGGGA